MGTGLTIFREEQSYEAGSPLVTGDTTPCFKEGRLYRIIKGDSWYYYNDTQDSKMEVRLEFSAGSTVEVCSMTSLEKCNADGSCTVRMEILPLDTVKMIVVKKVTDVRYEFTARAFTEAEVAAYRKEAGMKVQAEMVALQHLLQNNNTTDVTNEEELLKLVCSTEDVNYVDLFFPPSSCSIYREGIDRAPGKTLCNLDEFSWRRPEDFLPQSLKGNTKLFTTISPQDIGQGDISDCHLLSCCAMLAAYPHSIRAIFANHEPSSIITKEQSRGAWRVNLNIHGWWRSYIIDSYLPIKTLLPSFARNRHHANELWVSFLEKAYAKAYGSYQAISTGFHAQILEDLTGYPSYSFAKLWPKVTAGSNKLAARFFNQLQFWCNAKYLLAFSPPTSVSAASQGSKVPVKTMRQRFKQAALLSGYSYSVVEVRHVPDCNVCLFKIYNPAWKKSEWCGKWKEGSPLWKSVPPSVRAACRPDQLKRGYVWMEWKEVTEFFNGGCVFFYPPILDPSSPWHDYRVPGSFLELWPDRALEITVGSESFTAFLVLSQRDRRGLDKADPDATYAPIMLSLSEGDVNSTVQKIVTNSSEYPHPVEPTSEYIFQVARSVALRYVFKPNRKYYAIPRCMASNKERGPRPAKRFVIGMLASQALSSSTVVEVVAIDKNCNVFENATVFEVEVPQKRHTVYQVRKSNGVLKTRVGTSLNKGAPVGNASYELGPKQQGSDGSSDPPSQTTSSPVDVAAAVAEAAATERSGRTANTSLFPSLSNLL